MIRRVLFLFALVWALFAPLAFAAPGEWSALSATERALLAPLSADWDQMPPPMRAQMLRIAERYPQMPPEQQARMRERIGEWARLTPEERERARDNYKRLQSLPPEERERLRNALRGEYRKHGSGSASRPHRRGSEGARHLMP